MQDLQPIPGLAGRLFGGGSSATVQWQVAAAAAAEVRCPRCGSANTKFCYYNNYNLAQPRHLCRACRRYWTKGGHLRNVPVGGGCRRPKPSKRPAAADGSNKNCAHGAHRDGKAPRSGFAGAGASSAADGSALSVVVTGPSGSGSSSVTEAGAGASSCAAGDTRALLLVPPPPPMFADQAAVFASFFAPPPRHFPAFGSSAQAKAEEHVAGLLAAEQQPPASAVAGEGAASPFSARSDGALAAGASDDAGISGLSGGIAGDASLPAYWNTGGWTDPDTTVYLPLP